MGKLTIQEIARVLIEKNGLDKREANRFVTEMFALIQERLETDQLVKVKGLGTFKVISVEARESVSVRTGERVIIGSHAKVVFTPDKLMSELVNKPFSQFETVVLNDGVEFEDMLLVAPDETADPDDNDVERAEAVVAEGNEPAVEETIVEEETAIEEIAEEGATAEEAAADEETAAERETIVAEDIEAETAAEEEDVEDDEDVNSRSWLRWLLCVMGILVLMLISAYGGYLYGLHKEGMTVTADTTVVPATMPADTVAVASFKRDSLAQDSVQMKEVKKDTVKQAVAPKDSIAGIDPYAAKDVRVRLGAYRIVGTDREVTVRAGQTLSGISRSYLGPDMECYVEVYNELTPGAKLKEGQTIKIPKLALKKRKK